MLFFLSEFFQYNDDFYGDLYGDFYGDTFVATNFLISLFLFFPLYNFSFILLASQRASLAKGSDAPTDPPPPGYAPVKDLISGLLGFAASYVYNSKTSGVRGWGWGAYAPNHILQLR